MQFSDNISEQSGSQPGYVNMSFSPKKKNKKTDRKLIAFDFDKTLSQIHLYSYLSERGAQTEIMQLQKIKEYNQDNKKFSNVDVFGGESRINLLATYLNQFKQLNCDIIVVTKGYVGSATRTLIDVNLLQYFSMIYGNIGSYYTYNSESEDSQTQEAKNRCKDLLGKNLQDLNRFKQQKDELLENLRVKQNLRKNQVILVDDDVQMIQGINSKDMTGLQVDGNKGIQEKHLNYLIEWAQMF